MTRPDPRGLAVPAGWEVDPVCGFVHAPEDLDALPPGTCHGELAISDAPQGAREAASKIDDNWTWRLIDGEGWATREGKGPVRDNGTRPKIRILLPCRSVTLRAVGVDQAFPDTTHHVVLAWVYVYERPKWAAEGGWAGTTEPFLGQPLPGGRVSIRRGWTAGPRALGVTRCRALLAGPPDVRRLEALLEPLEVDAGVST